VQPDGRVLLSAEWVGGVMAGVPAGVRPLSVREAWQASPLVRDLLATLPKAREVPACCYGSGSAEAGPVTMSLTVAVREAASALECSDRWIRALLESGRLGGRKSGGTRLVDAGDLEAFRRRTEAA
jgi:excisionase family DNA binding protein